MQQHCKERVAGSILILAIAAVFLPILFHHPLPGLQDSDSDVNLLESPHAVNAVHNLPLITHGDDNNEQDHSDNSAMQTVANLRNQVAKPRQISAAILSPKQQVTYKPARSDIAVGAKLAQLSAIGAVLPQTWVVQIATFSKLKHAEGFIKQLKQKNVAAYVRKVTLGDKSLYRVYVGPYIKYDKAITLQKYVQYILKTNGIVKKYTL